MANIIVVIINDDRFNDTGRNRSGIEEKKKKKQRPERRALSHKLILTNRYVSHFEPVLTIQTSELDEISFYFLLFQPRYTQIMLSMSNTNEWKETSTTRLNGKPLENTAQKSLWCKFLCDFSSVVVFFIRGKVDLILIKCFATDKKVCLLCKFFVECGWKNGFVSTLEVIEKYLKQIFEPSMLIDFCCLMANHFAVSHKIVSSIAFHRTCMYVFCSGSMC